MSTLPLHIPLPLTSTLPLTLRVNSIETENAKCEAEKAKYETMNEMTKVQLTLNLTLLQLLTTLTLPRYLKQIKGNRREVRLRNELSQNKEHVEDLMASLKHATAEQLVAQKETKQLIR